MRNKLHLDYGSKTLIGKNNPYNTDSILDFPIPNGHVFVVCDGHNGEEGHGALASKLTTESIKKYFYNKSYKDIHKALTNAVTFANYNLYEQSLKEPKYKGIATTIAILIYSNDKVYYAYAGDSRIYRFCENKLIPLTSDHVKDTFSPATSELTVLLGKSKDLKFGVCKSPLEVSEQDRFLLCTDGVTDCLSETDIADIIADDDTLSAHKSLRIIETVGEKGGGDNASIHILDFSVPVETKQQVKPKKGKKLLLLSLLFLIFVVASVAVYFKRDSIFKKPVLETKLDLEEKETDKDKGLTDKENIVEDDIDKESSVGTEVEGKNIAEAKIENDNEVKKEDKPVVNEKEKVEEYKTSKPVFYKHHVKYGENLYRLGLRYNVPQKKIIEINGKKAKVLTAGGYLDIPVRAVYNVKNGDSFSVVSDKFEVKIALIKQANKIKENEVLRMGQELIIPIP